MFCTRTGVQGLILYKYNQCTMPKIIGTFVLGDDFQCQQAQDVQVPNGLMFTATSALCFTFIWTVNMVSSWKVTYAFRHHDCIMLVPLSDCHQLDYILHKSMVIIAASLRHATQYEFGRHCVPFSPLSFHFLLTWHRLHEIKNTSSTFNCDLIWAWNACFKPLSVTQWHVSLDYCIVRDLSIHHVNVFFVVNDAPFGMLVLSAHS